MIKIDDSYKENLNTLPELPGIYKMIDTHGVIIYIGKSKCLKKRVKSYFAAAPKWEKVKKMVSFIDTIDYTVTDTHLEARLLECELIKFHQPLFNAQMKNDKNYMYLKIEVDPRGRALSLVPEREAGTYGPFRRKHALEDLLELLKNIYPIGYRNAAYEFEYHLFPVKMDGMMFQENRSSLTAVLTDESKMELFLSHLDQKMKEASASYKFETAALYRDILMGFQYLKNGINGYKNLFSKNLLLKMPLHGGKKLFFVSKGHILAKEFFPSLTRKEIKKFVRQGNLLLEKSEITTNEKAQIDYRDILYSEILTLSEDMIDYLN